MKPRETQISYWWLRLRVQPGSQLCLQEADRPRKGPWRCKGCSSNLRTTGLKIKTTFVPMVSKCPILRKGAWPMINHMHFFIKRTDYVCFQDWFCCIIATAHIFFFSPFFLFSFLLFHSSYFQSWTIPLSKVSNFSSVISLECISSRQKYFYF